MSNSLSAIQTFTGVFVDPFNPDPDSIRIEDVAHALSNQCRYSGHTRPHWSVAAHSCLVSLLCPDDHKLDGLLHDAHEAYCLDIARPIKQHPSMYGYRALEATIEAAVRAKFGSEPHKSPEVEFADNVALWAEAEELLHGTEQWEADRPWKTLNQVVFARERIREMLELDSEKLFLSQFYILTGVDVHANP